MLVYRTHNKIHLDPGSGIQRSPSDSGYRPVVCILVMYIICRSQYTSARTYGTRQHRQDQQHTLWVCRGLQIPIQSDVRAYLHALYAVLLHALDHEINLLELVAHVFVVSPIPVNACKYADMH